jgi:DNA-directed RNA polymerase specialized sigma24 family protein/ribosome-associated translation inhibitor RaiA
MNVHISYKLPKTPDLEKEFNHQIEKLKRRLQVFRPELVHLRGNIEENNARQGFVVSVDLRLPSGDMAARESGPTATAAIKAVFDQLVEQVTKHKDMLRNQHKWPRRRRVGRTRPQPQVPFEETLASVQPATISSEDINGYINANLGPLCRYVERELRYRENIGALRRDQLMPEEVVDEAVANALGSNGEKPERLALEPWLYRLAIRALDELAARTREEVLSVPLDHAVRQTNMHNADEAQLQFHQPDEAVANSDLIADIRTSTPEASAATDEMITLVEAALLGAKREDREAFLLYAVEGFTPEEIAAISDRPGEQVRLSINAAREHLRKALPMPDEFKDKLLQHSKIA